MLSEYLEKRHIVIVDDEPVNLEIAENTLGETYKLTKLISGEQLLKFLNRIIPDMILLDVMMPGMDGYETLKAITANPRTKDIPVIFLTSQEGLDSERMCFRLGAKDFIKKPFDNEIMLSRVRSQMELHIYRTQLEDVIDDKTAQISNLQHLLTISWAEMIESRDGTTGSHVRNTTAYYEILVKALSASDQFDSQFTDSTMGDLLRASTLHDIGKIGISDTILKKPGPLEKDEFKLMQTHSQIGANMIQKIVSETSFDNFLNYAKEMAWFHHERWDGTGYPFGLRGQSVPAYVRALSIVDVYDALTSVRPYKEAFSHEKAMDIISSDSGKFFDPDIFRIFLENESLFKKYKKS